MKATVRLNCTEESSFRKFGLLHNPFPRDGRWEFCDMNVALSILEATPLPTVDHLKRTVARLKLTKKFVDLCLTHYKQGEVVTFDIQWGD